MKDTRIYLRVATEMKDAWEEYAEEEGVTLSQLIIDLVDGKVQARREIRGLSNDITSATQWRAVDTVMPGDGPTYTA